MRRQTPVPTRTDTLLHYAPLFRSRTHGTVPAGRRLATGPRRSHGHRPGRRGRHPAVDRIRARAPEPLRRSHPRPGRRATTSARSEEHTSELQSLMRISYAVFCLKKKKSKITETRTLSAYRYIQRITTT